MKEHIADIAGLKADIKMAFELFSSRFGVFSNMPHKLEKLEYDVLDAIRVYTEYMETPSIKLPLERPVEPVCVHKWRDSEHWYFALEVRDNVAKYKIVEPYVCVFCKERKDVELETGVEPISDTNSVQAIIKGLKQSYPKLRDRAIVEDEINDAILVDREYLRILDSLRDARKPAKIELKLPSADKEDSG